MGDFFERPFGISGVERFPFFDAPHLADGWFADHIQAPDLEFSETKYGSGLYIHRKVDDLFGIVHRPVRARNRVQIAGALVALDDAIEARLDLVEVYGVVLAPLDQVL